MCPQKDNHLISKKIPLLVPSLSTLLLNSSANTAGRDNIEMDVSIPQNATVTKGHCLELYSAPAVLRKGQVLDVLNRNVIFHVKLSLLRVKLSSLLIPSEA